MKRKKWSEAEEETLISHYSHLLSSGTLSKLKTREKKFRPIADYLNSFHHLRDPISFPFSWSWRDVSIKVQNMRHQYIGVKHKIRRPSDGDFNWSDGENHWDNFLKYKEVFGDVELDFNENSKKPARIQLDGYGLGFDVDCEGFDENEESGDEEEKEMKKRRMSLLGGELLQLRDAMVRREEGRSERDFVREGDLVSREGDRREKERLRESRKMRDEEEGRELEEMEFVRAKRRESERRLWLERELDEERQWRRRMEERREEEEFQWRERLVSMQIQHEKQMIQMQANACQNQLQVLGVMARFMCQFFGSASDGLSAGLGALPPHILQHPGGLGDNGKPDSNSPSEFL